MKEKETRRGWRGDGDEAGGNEVMRRVGGKKGPPIGDRETLTGSRDEASG